MAIVCLMTMISVNAQGFREKAIKDAIKEVRLNLKAPSTFILTDAYGYKIPVSKVSATFLKEKVEYCTMACGEYVHTIDSIDYLYTVDSVFVDSIVHTSYKHSKDSIEYIKVIYPAQYKVSFFYEAQNSLGGMVQGHAEYYVTRDCVHSSRFYYNKTLRTEKNPNVNVINDNVKKTYSYIYKPKKTNENNFVSTHSSNRKISVRGMMIGFKRWNSYN